MAGQPGTVLDWDQQDVPLGTYLYLDYDDGTLGWHECVVGRLKATACLAVLNEVHQLCIRNSHCACGREILQRRLRHVLRLALPQRANEQRNKPTKYT